MLNDYWFRPQPRRGVMHIGELANENITKLDGSVIYTRMGLANTGS